MIKFLKYTGWILIITIASAYLLETLYTHAFTTGFSRNKTQYVVQLKETHIDYIFLGSSRVENNIDCELVTQLTGKSCINLGLQGSKTNYSAAILQILKDHKVTYEKVLFQLDYAVNFDSYVPAFLSSIAPYQHTDLLSSEFKKKLHTPSIQLPFVRYAANDKMIGLREVLLQLYKKPPNMDLSNGFVGIDRTGSKMKGSLPAEISDTNHGVNWLRESEPNHLILYTAPYCKNASNRDVFVKKLEEAYPQVISFIYLFDQTDTYFADCGHLNRNGASRFTRILVEELLLNKNNN
jgi:hypothetical protein